MEWKPLGSELMDSSLSPTKRRALRNDTQPCRLFYIAVSTVSTYTTQNCFCPWLLSFLSPIHIHCDAKRLSCLTRTLSLSRRWLSSVEPFVNVRLSGGFHLDIRLVNCNGQFWFLATLYKTFEVVAREVHHTIILRNLSLMTRFAHRRFPISETPNLYFFSWMISAEWFRWQQRSS